MVIEKGGNIPGYDPEGVEWDKRMCFSINI